MSVYLYFLLVVSTFELSFGYLDNYHCGTGPLSKTLSYMTSYSCGTDLSKFNTKYCQIDTQFIYIHCYTCIYLINE